MHIRHPQQSSAFLFLAPMLYTHTLYILFLVYILIHMLYTHTIYTLTCIYTYIYIYIYPYWHRCSLHTHYIYSSLYIYLYIYILLLAPMPYTHTHTTCTLSGALLYTHNTYRGTTNIAHHENRSPRTSLFFRAPMLDTYIHTYIHTHYMYSFWGLATHTHTIYIEASPT
jgi:hypothetical protein